MDIYLVIWFLALHGVNTAMYLAVTRVARGWSKTLLGLGVFYGSVALALTLVRRAKVGPEVFAPYSFAFTFGCWLVLTVAMLRRGSRQAACFAAMLCGAHQLALGVVCHALMHHAEVLSRLVASALMLVLGLIMVCFLLPRIRHLSLLVDLKILNVAASILLMLIYATGFWPIWVAGGSWRGALPFVAAVLTLVSFFPVVFHLSERCQAAARLKQMEDNVRLLAEEMRTRRAAIDEARRIRHDRRHHCAALVEFLRAKQTDKALAYVVGLDAELQSAGGTRIWCENETVNAILSGYSRKALAAQVKLETEASVPRQLVIPDIELVAVLSNLIENAINASSSVTVQLVCRDDILRFRISNPVPAGFVLHDGWPCETSGVGLQSVRTVVERHGGGLDYVLEDGRLTARGFLSCV